ncbi:hypothetical protein [Rhodovastum atsumiense]|nr:hypothetical protein [Rhodovastum atsumiense]
MNRHAGGPCLRLRTRSPVPWRQSMHDFMAAWTKVMNLDHFDLA